MRTAGNRYSVNMAGLFIRRMKKSRWYRTLILRFCLIMALVLIGIPSVLALLFVQPAEAKAGTDEVYYKYYHRIEVETGDTLWSIAAENYLPAQQTISEYIAEVQQINHCNDGVIYAGEKLMIPYYSTEFIE